jgi:hypothetical protein
LEDQRLFARQIIPAIESITNSSEIITSPEVGTAKEDCLFFGA